MIVHIHKRENPFVQIDKRPLNNPRISYKAKGILAYLLSKPDGWKTNSKDLEAHSPEGTKSIRSGLAELAREGYAKLEKLRATNGLLLGQEWHIYEDVSDPTEMPKTAISVVRKGVTEMPKNGVSEKRSLAKGHTINNQGSNNNQSNIEGDQRPPPFGEVEGEPPAKNASLTEDEAVCIAQQVGVPDDKFSRHVFADWDSRDGRDASNVKVAWPKYIKKRWIREGIGWAGGIHKNNLAPAKNHLDRQIERLVNDDSD